MALQNIIVTPILSTSLALALRNTQAAAHEVMDENMVVDVIMNLPAKNCRTAFVVGPNPVSHWPSADESNDCHDLMVYTDSPLTLYRIMMRTAQRRDKGDLWLYEDAAHDVDLQMGDDLLHVTQEKGTVLDVLYMMRSYLGSRFPKEAVPHVVNMSAYSGQQVTDTFAQELQDLSVDIAHAST